MSITLKQCKTQNKVGLLIHQLLVSVPNDLFSPRQTMNDPPYETMQRKTLLKIIMTLPVKIWKTPDALSIDLLSQSFNKPVETKQMKVAATG